jgi:hypothetical protein
MLTINKQKVSSFVKRCLPVFLLGVCGWELSHYTSDRNDLDLHDLLQSGMLFIAIFSFMVLIVSFFQGWISFDSNDD